MAPEGGLRDRLVHESLTELLRSCLSDLGWFNTVDPAVRRPVNLRTMPARLDEEIQPNVVVVTPGDDDTEDVELGSTLAEHTREYWVEVYAEDEAILNHLRGDIEAILRGKHPGCGRDAPTMDLIDWTVATPVKIGTMLIEGVRGDRPRIINRPWQQFMAGIHLLLVEER